MFQFFTRMCSIWYPSISFDPYPLFGPNGSARSKLCILCLLPSASSNELVGTRLATGEGSSTRTADFPIRLPFSASSDMSLAIKLSWLLPGLTRSSNGVAKYFILMGIPPLLGVTSPRGVLRIIEAASSLLQCLKYEWHELTKRFQDLRPEGLTCKLKDSG